MRIVFNIANHHNPKSGGLKIFMYHMDWLHEAGFDVRIYYYNYAVYEIFKDMIDIIKYPLVHIDELNENDLVVIAEEFAWVADLLLPRRVPYIIVNQGVSGTFRSGISFQRHKELYLNAKKILVNSNHSEQGVIEFFDMPREKIYKFRIGIDRNIYSPGIKENQISYMSYKNGEFVSWVDQYIQLYKDYFNVQKIHLLPQNETVEIMKKSKLFLAFGGPEGFGMPPLEAAFCGCKVVGFHGGGGEEFWREPVFKTVPLFDHVVFVQKFKEAIENLDYWDSNSIEYVDFLRDFYSIERAKKSIITIYDQLVTRKD